MRVPPMEVCTRGPRRRAWPEGRVDVGAASDGNEAVLVGVCELGEDAYVAAVFELDS
jgi:hypothetical protein